MCKKLSVYLLVTVLLFTGTDSNTAFAAKDSGIATEETENAETKIIEEWQADENMDENKHTIEEEATGKQNSDMEYPEESVEQNTAESVEQNTEESARTETIEEWQADENVDENEHTIEEATEKQESDMECPEENTAETGSSNENTEETQMQEESVSQETEMQSDSVPEETMLKEATEPDADEKEVFADLSSSELIASGTIDEDYGHITWSIDADGKLLVEGTGDFADPDKYDKYDIERAPWYNNREAIFSAEVNVTGMRNAGYMFYDCSNLVNIDVDKFDTSNITDMFRMFESCSSLTSLNLSKFDTKSVTNMNSMFSGCSSLTNLDVSKFDTKSVTNMNYMFSRCSSLTSLDVGKFNTKSVTGMEGMFSECSNLINLDVSKFDTKNVILMDSMFSECSSLTNLDLSKFDTVNVTSMCNMFWGCNSLTSLDLSKFNTGNVKNMSGMFSECSNLTSLDLSNFDTKSVTIMSGMFWDCSNLTSLDLSNFNTGSVTSMFNMFINCSSLISLDLSNFDTKSVTIMDGMFSGCSSLTSLDLSKFDTKSVKLMGNMFSGCSSLTSLDLSNFDTKSVTNMNNMFYSCSNLSTINSPYNLNKSVSLPTANANDIWYLSDGSTVTELPQNLNHSVILGKNYIPKESQESTEELRYVQNLTRESLKNADAESRESIQNALCNLMFQAEYRPVKSNIPGDTMVFTGSKDVIAKWPIQNKDYNTTVFWNKTVNDAQLGKVEFNAAAAGCMAYAYFTSAYVYATTGMKRTSTDYNGDVKHFISCYADPGEQIRYNSPHSIVFVGESADGKGFYYISYGGGVGKNGTSHDLSLGLYVTYEDFASVVNKYGGTFYIYDTNGGSYYNHTARSVANVRSGNGAAKMVVSIACPVEGAIALGSEVLDSRSPGAASFGTVERKGEEIVFTLNYSEDYSLTVNGTGEGTMTLSLEYYNDSNDMIDKRVFEKVPIKESTEIKSSGFDSQADFVLYVSDKTGDLNAWAAGTNETVSAPDNIDRGDNEADEEENVCIVTFDSDGGSAVAPQTIQKNEKASEPDVPVKDGYRFTGWFLDGVLFDFNTAITSDITLKAMWMAITKAAPAVPDITSGSEVEKGTRLTLSCEEGALIYYTVDETMPDRNSILYRDPIIINTDVTIKAIVIKEGFEDSDVVVLSYRIKVSDAPDEHHEGLWISGLDESGYLYTGEAVKPVIKVYDYKTLLTEKTDYTIKYKNNIKAGTATITVTGKGNYSGKETADFKILPVDISNSEVYAMDFVVKTGTKAQKPVPELYYMGTKLKNNKDFKITYSNTSGIYAQAAEHTVTITGTGSFTGTRTLKLTAVEKLVKPKPINISKASLSGFVKSVVYTGGACTQTCTLSINSPEGVKTLVEGADYTTGYVNNIKVGTATVTFYGKNGYAGKLRKTYKITAYDISTGNDFKYNMQAVSVFAKGGSKPKPAIAFNGTALKEGIDYTLVYKNNTSIKGSKTPSVIIKGKGNFKGKRIVPFSIEAQDLSKMSLVSCDKVYKNKANIYRITPKLMDLDGKLLTAGKDYNKNSITYAYAKDTVLDDGTLRKAGDMVDKTDIIPADTPIRITLECGSKGNYKGTFTGTYRIIKADLKSAKVTIPNQIYTGNEITPDKTQITVKLSGKTLLPEDYEITGYSNNIKKGKAFITIKGNGNYGGTKTVKFNIVAKGFLWWWR